MGVVGCGLRASPLSKCFLHPCDDYKNPMFVISASSSAGGLTLGVVVTSGESSSIIKSAMNHLLSKGSFYGKGSPDNIITDDA